MRGSDFDTFVLGASTRLLRSAYLLTGDRHTAEDLVQDVLSRMYVAWPRIDDPHACARRALVQRVTNRWRNRRLFGTWAVASKGATLRGRTVTVPLRP